MPLRDSWVLSPAAAPADGLAALRPLGPQSFQHLLPAGPLHRQPQAAARAPSQRLQPRHPGKQGGCRMRDCHFSLRLSPRNLQHRRQRNAAHEPCMTMPGGQSSPGCAARSRRRHPQAPCTSVCPSAHAARENCWPPNVRPCSLHAALQHRLKLLAVVQHAGRAGKPCLPADGQDRPHI